MHEFAARRDNSERDAVVRWECRCQEPPVLLGTYDATGKVNIKVRDRYWHVIGRVSTICPKCGAEHSLSPEQNRPDVTIDVQSPAAHTP